MAPKKETGTEVAAPNNSSLPAHLQGQTKTAKVGNLDRSDLIIPRIKLLQGVSPEIEAFDNAKIGQYWHTTAAQLLGAELNIIPIVIRKSYILWAPRGDDRGILARAMDALNWDQPGAKFTVKPKKSPHEVTYELGKTVHDNGLSKFGSSIPGDPNSPPAASLTYEMLAYLPDHPELGAAIIINTRSSVKPFQGLVSRLDLSPVDHYNCVFKMGVATQTNDGDEFKNYTYVANGYATEEQSEVTKKMFEQYRDADFAANDQTDDSAEGGGGSRSSAGPSDNPNF